MTNLLVVPLSVNRKLYISWHYILCKQEMGCCVWSYIPASDGPRKTAKAMGSIALHFPLTKCYNKIEPHTLYTIHTCILLCIDKVPLGKMNKITLKELVVF